MSIETSGPELLPKGLKVIVRSVLDPSEAPTVILKAEPAQTKLLPLLANGKGTTRSKASRKVDPTVLRTVALGVWALVALAGTAAAIADMLLR